MESAPEWCRLLLDCMDGKVDLIITQKVSNVTKKPYEITILSRMLATLPKPVGIYFISEDIFTLASYYREDMKDTDFFPQNNYPLFVCSAKIFRTPVKVRFMGIILCYNGSRTKKQD